MILLINILSNKYIFRNYAKNKCMRYIIFLLVFIFSAGPVVETIQANTASHASVVMAAKKKRKKPAKKRKKPVKKKKKRPAPKRKSAKKSSKKSRVRYPF
jgi:hypothetical protein